MRIHLVLSLSLMLGCSGPESRDAAEVRPPRLENREQILTERQAIADRLLNPGDSIIVPVYIYVDSLGMPRAPEVKMEPLDPRVRDAAIALVRNMRFQPATKDGQPTTVMLTVPVKLVRR